MAETPERGRNTSQEHPVCRRTIRNNSATFTHVATLDLKKYYQQFELVTKHMFAVVYDSEVYELDTIPTGAVFPPLFGHLLSTTMLKASIERTDTERTVKYDACIDNLRLMSNNARDLAKAWKELINITETVQTTIGEIMPPPSTFEPATQYTYLGMDVSAVQQHGYRDVSVSEKSATKAKEEARKLRDEQESELMRWRDAQCIFGITVWLSTVTNTTLGHVYHVMKYMRRRSRTMPNEDDAANIWKCIKSTWADYIERCTRNSYTHTATGAMTARVYSDASMSGWGVVILDLPHRRHIICGDKWHHKKQFHINKLELMATQIALRILKEELNGKPCAVKLYVDNTSTRTWTEKARAPTYLANQIAVDIKQICDEAGIRLDSCSYIPSADNPADAPSRGLHRL